MSASLLTPLSAADEKPAPAAAPAAAPAKAAVSSVPRVPAELHALLQAKKFDEAVAWVDKAVADEKTPARDYLRYLKARAQVEADESDAAYATYVELEKLHPQSVWLTRSRFGRGQILFKKKNYEGAGAIYRAETERLLSAGRRDELTAIYLEFADKFFEGERVAGPTSERKPDYAQALTYYVQALQMTPSLARRQEIEVRIGRCHQELQQHNEALSAYQRYLAQYASPTTKPAERSPPKLEAEVRYRLGQVQLAIGQPAEARKTWQDFLASAAAKEAGGDLVPEATYRIAHTHGVPAPPTVGEMELGVAALEKFVKAYPKHRLAAQAEFEIAQSYFAHGRYEQVVTTLKALIANEAYVKTSQVPQARQLIGQAYLGQKKYAEAIAAWREFLDEHPTDPQWSTVQQMIIDTEFAIAQAQADDHQWAAARKSWETFLNKYPLDPRAAQILLNFGSMQLAEALELKALSLKANDKSVDPARIKVLLEAALADWQRLVSKYPNTGEASRAAFLIGVTLEDHLDRLADALAAYQKVTGPAQSEAQQRIAALTAKQLQIVTERKFRTGEPAVIKVTTRNLESVSVKAYRVDLTDYFRKMHQAGGVESLDITLIDPDKAWDEKITNYEQYRRVENAVTIPLDGPGVTAVTVSSDTLEATTMVVVSDIDVIVKSSRNEMFVFAENLRTGKPAAGVTLLLSDGQKIYAEEKTDDHGILQKSFEELKSSQESRVFAVLDGHTASSITSLNGLDFAVGLSPKGYLYTDRPAYRAGQIVHLRGLVRWVSGDQYTFKKGDKYQLDVYDARGRIIHTRPILLGDFGTFADHFTLPPAAPQGDYRVCVHQPGGNQSYESTFGVHEYQLEPLRLAIDLPRKVYYRGEPVQGKIVLKYYYGTPLAGRTITYRLGDDRLYTAVTDAKGEVPFDLPTQRYSESQPLQLVASYPERSLNAGETVYLATRGFEVGVKVQRSVYVLGETFDVSTNVADPAGKPVGAALKLEVLEQTNVRGKLGERLVATHEIAADEKAGHGRQTLRVDKAGTYILRASGVDRFGQTVSGATSVMISGQDDAVRLRILADQHQYHVGETAKIVLHWREPAALALVTYEGAQILGYKLVELKTGANPIELPCEAKLAPNFDLAVAVMQQNKFHEARSEFRVVRQLNIKLTPNKTELKPGEELTVDVVVTDPQGKPVAAETSVGLIQQNLLTMFGERAGNVEEFFSGGRRTVSMRAATSCTFRYAPSTRPISAFLLAEEDRRKVLEQEALSRSGLNGVLGGLGVPGAGGAGAAAGDAPATERDAEQAEAMDEAFDDQATGLANAPGRPGEGKPGQSKPRSQAGGKGQRFNKKSAEKAKEAKESGVGDFDSNGIALGDTSVNFKSPLPANGAIVFMVDGKSNLDLFLSQANGEIPVFGLNARGEQRILNGSSQDVLTALAAEGLMVVNATGQMETGYWNPAVVTDADGKARISFILPDQSTAWRLQAKGITGAALAGSSETEIVTKKDLFVEPKLPLAFQTGDKAQVLLEVHHPTLKAGDKVDVAFGVGDTEVKKTLTVGGTGISEIVFPIEIEKADEIAFKFTVTSGELRDVVRRHVPVLPYGMPVFATKSGSSAQNTTVFIQHDPALAVEESSLELLIGPSINRTLLDALLGGATTTYERSIVIPRSGLERAISDVLGGVALLKLIGQSRTSDTPEAQALAGRIQGSLAQIVSAQRGDGGWNWSGDPVKGDKADRYTSSRVLWALSSARKAGFYVVPETFDKAVAFVQSQFAASAEGDDEARAILLHGLAEAGAGDFAHANKLYRARQSLSASGLLHTALALIRLDRKNMAGDLLPLVQEKIDKDPPMPSPAADAALVKVIPWMQSGVEIRALYLMTLNEITPEAPRAATLANWLMSARCGGRWQPEKANGPALVALADWHGRAKLVPEKYTLTVFVNEKQVEKLTIDPSKEPTRRILVPNRFLGAGQQKINIDIDGRGTFSYSAILGGFVPAEKLKSTSKRLYVSRNYDPAPRMLDGEEIPRGFHILTGSYASYRNEVTQVPMGERVQVSIGLGRYGVRGVRDEQLDYIVVTEPIPSGMTVLTDSIGGNFERYELSPGAITFYIGDRPYPGGVHYALVGYLPGNYKAAPTVVRSFYEPDQIVVAAPKGLDVLGRDEKSKDAYVLTPVEMFEFGKRLSAKRDYAAADEHLTKLVAGKWDLQENIYREVIQLLFQTSLALNKPEQIVKYFEIIKEKFADVEVPFESILKVAAAYQELGEYERGYLVYRATAEANFLRESQIAGFLDQRGEFLRSVQVMERLLREYPPESYVATATYALAQEVYGKAPEAAAQPKLREAKVTRVDLIATAIHMLDHFLSTWPTDPAADQASFSISNALLDLEQFEAAIARTTEFAERYPESKLLDSFWYVIGYSQFALGRHEKALEMCRKVAELKRVDPATGVALESSNKLQALYIMGQVYHSLGQPAAAIGEYEKVKTQFSDALEAIEFFTRKEITLPEVTTVKPGDPAQPVLKFRNVAKIDAKVYRIDLLKFSLLQRNLAKITAINLAGIRPYHELNLDLGTGKDYGDKEKKLDLPLKEEGAYLVVCRGENLYTSGLVLVSPLALEIQEDAASGRVRVTVKDVVADKYEPEVHVKVIGTHNEQFVSGETDLRGIFIADGILGTSTVIAKKGANRYAFFRGKTLLGNVQPNAPALQQRIEPGKPNSGGQEQLLKQLRMDNGRLQQEQRSNYQNILNNSIRGVNSKDAF